MRVRTTVIIPVFNQAGLTAHCLGALEGGSAYEVMVVDDGSTDSTPQLLTNYQDRVRVLTHPANRGFAISCNHAAFAASSEFILFLNNDTIPQPGWIEALEAYAGNHPAAAVIGAKLLYPNNTIQHAGVVICQDHYPRHIYTGFPADHPAVNKSRRFQIVTAACALVRRSVFEWAGGFDTAFRNGFEDVDLCLRLGAAGHEIHYCADSVLHHWESMSPGRFKNDRENVALYRQRWLPRVQPDDLRYYAEDDLLSVSYEGSYPLHLQASPLLATLDGGSRTSEVERQLLQRSRQVADLTRENTRLRAELGQRTPESPALKYDHLRQQIRDAVREIIPPGATVLVVSKGDHALLELDGCQAWHFPQTVRGAYAGYHPTDSAEAIAHLETLRGKGAEYLVLPAPSLWWLDHYDALRQHLNERWKPLFQRPDTCLIFASHR